MSAARRLPRPGSAGLVILLAALTAAGPISTDLYLAAFPTLIADLKTDAASAQLTLSAFTLCFAVSGLVIGPMADRFGRRPVLLTGFAFYLAASLACALAASIDTLILLRAAQAIGAACGPIIARAIVRDLHDGHEAGRLLALMAATMGFIPAIAPSLGAAVLPFGGWRIQFLIMAAIAGSALAAVSYFLGETLNKDHVRPLAPGSLFADYFSLVSQTAFLVPVIMGALSFCGVYAFISAGSMVMQGIYAQTPAEFGLTFFVFVLGYVGGTTSGGRLVRRVGSRALIRAGCCMTALSGIVMAACLYSGLPGVWVILAPLTAYAFGNGLVVPQSMATALMPYPRMAGTASAMAGALHLGIAAIVGAAVGQAYDDTARPMVLAVLLSGIGSFCLMVYFERRAGRLD